MVIGIIGAGASGMAAAIAASDSPGARIVLLERQSRVGRKLLATGNGRCNLTNENACGGGYHGDDPEFSAAAIAAFPPEETRAWFHALGLYTVAEPSGRVYPYSDSANSVVDVLRFALNRPNIEVRTGFEVTRVRREKGGFSVESGAEAFRCDRLILACGGCAGSKLGGSMAGYALLRSLGHRVTPLRPSLVQLKTRGGAAALRGVRANCRAAIYRDGVPYAESTGEIQFTDYGLSGPVIFEISRDVCRGAGAWECRMDFLPQTQAQALYSELCRRRETALTAEELLTGILHNRLGRVLTKAAGVRAGEAAASLDGAALAAVCRAVKDYRVTLLAPMGMDCAQVTAGGADTAQFDPCTMESRLVPGLYACGELLDVDGDCGGYNLQWAWSSGRCAGVHAGRE